MASESGRFWGKVNISGPCWEWQASRLNGYGRFKAQGVTVYAHRWVWEHLVGEIPAGLTIDHLCRNRGCVNPDHLEPVTMSENVRRARALHKRKTPKVRSPRSNTTTCRNGHPWDDVYVSPSGKRQCRECSRQASARYYAKKTASRLTVPRGSLV